MKKSISFQYFLFAFLMAALFVACGVDQKEEFTEIKVKTTPQSSLLKFELGEKVGEIQGSELAFTVRTDQIKQVMESNYRDGTIMDEVYLAKEEGQYFLYGKGFNSKKESRIIRFPLKADSNGSLQVNGGTDSCAGVNCSYCVFTAGSGCDCNREGDWTAGKSYCNHSTSTGVANLHLLDVAIENAVVNGDNIEGYVNSSDVDPELLLHLQNGENFVTDTDFVIPEETVQTIYANSGTAPQFEGALTIPMGEYEVNATQGIIIIHIHIETEDYVIDIYIIIED